jgi:hypothetical protein
MDFGIALAPGVDAWRWVQRAEALGFSHAWIYDTQLLCADFFVAAALAADRTSRSASPRRPRADEPYQPGDANGWPRCRARARAHRLGVGTGSRLASHGPGTDGEPVRPE